MTDGVSFRRLLLVTAIVFVLLLAFLAGRVHAGADPTQAAAPVATSAPSDETDPYGGDPDGRDDQYGAPGDTVSPDGSGRLAPDGSGIPDPDPPQTSAS